MKMTWKKLIAMIANLWGQGHHDDYRPFLRVTRKNTSGTSNQGAGGGLPGYRRAFHFYSRNERYMALVLLWLGVKDVREQFPLWPVPHPHPLAGAPGTEGMRLCEGPGLLRLAREAGIKHGVYVGTNIPYIGTLDLLATVHRQGIPHLVAISCKPHDLILADDPHMRMLERLELERLYCEALSIPWKVADVKVLTDALIANLQWCMPDKSVATQLRGDPGLEEFADVLARHMHAEPLDRAIAQAAFRVGWSLERGNSAFRILAWQQRVDIDLSLPVLMTQPARPRGTILRDALRVSLLGEIDYE